MKFLKAVGCHLVANEIKQAVLGSLRAKNRFEGSHEIYQNPNTNLVATDPRLVANDILRFLRVQKMVKKA